jgi:CheY-like chemotaxis protein
MGDGAETHIGRRVLVLDDSEICREAESAMLLMGGFDVRSAQDLVEFDHLLESWKPEIILTDFHMPDIDGATLCKTLRSRLDWAKIPIVMFSSVGEQELAEIAKGAGADAYLSKNAGDGYLDLPDRLRQLCEEILL